MMFGTRASFPYLAVRSADFLDRARPGRSPGRTIRRPTTPSARPRQHPRRRPGSPGRSTGLRSAPRLFGRGYRAARIAGLRVPRRSPGPHARVDALAGRRPGLRRPDRRCRLRQPAVPPGRAPRIGFSSLLGLEPFLAEPGPVTFHGIPIRRQELTELPGSDRFQLVMFHHSFEHIATPERPSRRRRGSFGPAAPASFGPRWPTAPCGTATGWTGSGSHPPRHLFLFTRKALVDLARRVGLGSSKRWTTREPGSSSPASSTGATSR